MYRAGARELDRRLEAHLADPGKRAETAARHTAARALATARPLAPGAPRLAAQVQRLEAALAATARRPVRLRSDALTDVEVSGQPALGRFHTTELALPPGRYWAIGRRDGYREVRVEFAVEATTDPLTIEVSCQDPRPAGN